MTPAIVVALLLGQTALPPTNATSNQPIDVGRIDIGVTAEAPVGTAVVSGEVLERLDRRDLGQAVALLPGVTVRRLGPRNETGLYLRGFDLRQVPLFVDGLPVYVPYDGHVDLGRFLSSDVAEIRVSHGISSVLFGPNALGGAVNIVSKQATRRLEGELSAEAGRGDDRSFTGWLGGRVGQWSVMASGARLDADTYFLPNGTSRSNAYREDSRFAARVGFGNQRWNAMVGTSVGRGEKGSPPYIGADAAVRVRYWQWPRWDKDAVWATSGVTLDRAGYLRGRIWRDTFDSAQYMYDDATYTTQRLASSLRTIYDDHSDGGSIEWGAPIGRGFSARAVVHAKADTHIEFNEGEPRRRIADRIYSGGAELTWTSPRLTLFAAISRDALDARHADDYQQGRLQQFVVLDTNGVNPQVSARVQLPRGRVYALASRKTRLPTMNDRYSYRQGMALPNPKLQAERGLTIEAGYEVEVWQRVTLAAAAYRTGVDNLVQRFVVRPSVIQFQNIGEVVHRGIDLTAGWRAGATLRTNVNYSFLSRTNVADPAVALLDTPRHHVAVTAMWTPIARLAINGLIGADSSRPSQTNSGRSVTVPASSHVDLTGSWQVLRGISLEGSLLNATNQQIAYMEGYPEAGRAWHAGVRWKF